MKCVWLNKNSDVKCVVDKENSSVRISGVLGSVEQVFKGDEVVFTNDGALQVKSKSSLGYVLSRITSLLEGVDQGYFIELEITGRGYRFLNLTDRLLVKLGSMHYTGLKVSPGLKIVGSRDKLIIFGLDLEEVHRVASTIRSFKVPDAYKGKGVRYVGEELVLKVGKKS